MLKLHWYFWRSNKNCRDSGLF